MATLEVTRRQYRPKSYTAAPVVEEECRFSPEMEARIERSMAQVERGEYITLRTKEEIRQFFNRV